MKKELAFELGLYALCIVLVGPLWHKPVILTFCYILISIVVLAKWHSKNDLLFYFITFFLGPIRRVGGNLSWGLGVYKAPLFDSFVVALLMGDLRSVPEKYF